MNFIVIVLITTFKTGSSDDKEKDDSGGNEKLDKSSEVEKLDGKMYSSPKEERLMHSVLEAEKDKVEDGLLLNEAIDQNLGSFTPDLMFQNMVQNYKAAKKLMGETLIRELTGYTPDYVEKNVNIPEFQNELKSQLYDKVNSMKEKGLINKDGVITQKGLKLASVIMFTDELDSLVSKGFGKKEIKEKDDYGEKEDAVPFKKSLFKFKNVALKRSIKTAIRRGHETLELQDLRAHEHFRKGRIQVIYGMDSSGSMRGNKIRMSKKAGVALSFKAIEDGNEAGLLVFDSKIKKQIAPTKNFNDLIEELTTIRAGQETDLTKAINTALMMFDKGDHTKHLILLTDGMPTRGKDPGKEAVEAAGIARDQGVTISVVGIGMDKEGEKLIRKITEVAQGKVYFVRDLEKLDAVVLQDLDSL